jgi:nucleotide-binding universal stress UspA family protein
MYERILVTVEVSEADRTIIEHVKPLAKALKSTVILLHIATGAPAKWKGEAAGGEEIEGDQAYLAKVKAELSAEGIQVETEMGFGNPADEIVKWVNAKQCDLIAMSTHGHRFFGDLFYGATAHNVQHRVTVPMLLLRVKS